jgi:hypothetical protein
MSGVNAVILFEDYCIRSRRLTDPRADRPIRDGLPHANLRARTDRSRGPARVLEAYGLDVLRPGTYAANCLLARRPAERGVRFVWLFLMGWDHHNDRSKVLRGWCRDAASPARLFSRI